MKEYMQQLKNKYGYSEELLDFLSKLIPCLIDYYGEEYKNIICEAIMNCEIHIQNKDEDIKTFLNKYFNTNKEWELPFSAGGFHHREIYLKNNQVSEKNIIYISTGGAQFYFPFKFNNDSDLDKLIHEILHLIKSFGKLKMCENHIIERSGLIKTFYTYDEANCVTFESKQNSGIEEAFTCVESSQILEMMSGREQEIRGYSEAGEIAKVFLKNEDFVQLIRKAQFNGDDSWIDFIGKEQSETLNENFMILVYSAFASFKILNTPEKIKQFEQMKQNAKEALNEILNQLLPKKF